MAALLLRNVGCRVYEDSSDLRACLNKWLDLVLEQQSWGSEGCNMLNFVVEEVME